MTRSVTHHLSARQKIKRCLISPLAMMAAFGNIRCGIRFITFTKTSQIPLKKQTLIVRRALRIFNTHQTEFSTLKKIFPNIKEQSVSFLRLMREPTYRDFVVKLTVPIKCHRVANKVWLENAGKVDVAVYPPAGGDTTTPGSSGKETGQNKTRTR